MGTVVKQDLIEQARERVCCGSQSAQERIREDLHRETQLLIEGRPAPSYCARIESIDEETDMTKTTLTLFGHRYSFPTEKEAYLFAVEKFLSVRPGLFTDPQSVHARIGRYGTPMFAETPDGMNQPERLSNGWFVETCLNNRQKVQNLDKLAQCAGFKRGIDWHWEAEGQEAPGLIDGEAILADLARFLMSDQPEHTCARAAH